jgi:hypothetical protein
MRRSYEFSKKDCRTHPEIYTNLYKFALCVHI